MAHKSFRINALINLLSHHPQLTKGDDKLRLSKNGRKMALSGKLGREESSIDHPFKSFIFIDLLPVLPLSSITPYIVTFMNNYIIDNLTILSAIWRVNKILARLTPERIISYWWEGERSEPACGAISPKGYLYSVPPWPPMIISP